MVVGDLVRVGPPFRMDVGTTRVADGWEGVYRVVKVGWNGDCALAPAKHDTHLMSQSDAEAFVVVWVTEGRLTIYR